MDNKGNRNGKQRVGFSIDETTYLDFENYCKDNYINKSKLIDKLIQNFLKKEMKTKKEV